MLKILCIGFVCSGLWSAITANGESVINVINYDLYKSDEIGEGHTKGSQTADNIERASLKPVRRELTDVIQSMGNDKWTYKKYTDLAYKVVTGDISRKLREKRGAAKNDRAIDYMTADEIHAVTEMQYRIAILLELGMDYPQIKDILLQAVSFRMAS